MILDNNYNIEICPYDKISAVQEFIRSHWNSSHALLESRELMNWQHYDAENSVYNFVIAWNIEVNEVHGILGFIPTKQYDSNICHYDIWLAIWKIRDDIRISGLGLMLLDYLQKKYNPHSIIGIGINTKVVPIYKYLGFNIGYLNHYYIANKNTANFELIKNFDGKYVNKQRNNGSGKLIEVGKSEYFKLCEQNILHFNSDCFPNKSLIYFYHRYFCHPIYKYHVYKIIVDDSINGFVFFRNVNYKSRNALRLVEFWGAETMLSEITQSIEELLIEYDAEYLDFYNIGIPGQALSQAGFLRRDQFSDIVIPNYFEPFTSENTNLNYAYKCNNKKLKFFSCKGDSDQDRPNWIL